jgi:hypothetical protein
MTSQLVKEFLAGQMTNSYLKCIHFITLIEALMVADAYS